MPSLPNLIHGFKLILCVWGCPPDLSFNKACLMRGELACQPCVPTLTVASQPLLILNRTAARSVELDVPDKRNGVEGQGQGLNEVHNPKHQSLMPTTTPIGRDQVGQDDGRCTDSETAHDDRPGERTTQPTPRSLTPEVVTDALVSASLPSPYAPTPGKAHHRGDGGGKAYLA